MIDTNYIKFCGIIIIIKKYIFFGDIPIKDIQYLLSKYNQSLNNDIYLTAWNYILTHPNINVPISIANWINIYNLLDEKDTFNILPDEVVSKILSELNYDQILPLCRLSNRFKLLCTEYKSSIFNDPFIEKVII